jgi:hypothetical protein
MIGPGFSFGKKTVVKTETKVEAKIINQNKNKVKWVNPLKDKTRVVPFIVPEKERRMAALGSLAGVGWRIKKSLQAIIEDFEPVK